jgi:transcriptional regulator with XRE-family HTH domain
MSSINTPQISDADERIGRMMRALCDLLNITHQDLADRIGMRPQNLSQKMRGKRPWRSREVQQVAAALGVPLPVLLRDPDIFVETLRAEFVNYR